jgi:hypothetical protein
MHATETDLALYAGRDLDFWARWRVSRHVRSCTECRAKVAAYQDQRTQLQHVASELPPNVDWDNLAAEMTANIHLGLAAGECVAPAPKPVEFAAWRPAAVLAGVAVIVAAAWFADFQSTINNTTNVAKAPAAVQKSVQQQGVLLEASATGIEFNDNGRVLSLQHPKDTDVTISMNLNTVRARYVDSQSGQVTINNVYVQ